MSSNAPLTIDRPTQMPLMNRRTSILTGLAAATLAATASAQDARENPELENVRALLKAHDDAMKRQDLPAILALFAEKAAIMYDYNNFHPGRPNGTKNVLHGDGHVAPLRPDETDQIVSK